MATKPLATVLLVLSMSACVQVPMESDAALAELARRRGSASDFALNQANRVGICEQGA